MENRIEKEIEEEIRETIKRNERSIISGCFQSILAIVVLIILWVVMIGALTFLAKVCWEVIKRVWSIW